MANKCTHIHISLFWLHSMSHTIIFAASLLVYQELIRKKEKKKTLWAYCDVTAVRINKTLSVHCLFELTELINLWLYENNSDK